MKSLFLSFSLFLIAGQQPVRNEAKKTSENVVKEEIQLLKKAADLMTPVKDKETADIAVIGIKALRKDALAYWANNEKLSKLTTEQAGEFGEKLKEEGQAVVERLYAELERIPRIKGGREVRQEIQALTLAMIRGCDCDGK